MFAYFVSQKCRNIFFKLFFKHNPSVSSKRKLHKITHKICLNIPDHKYGMSFFKHSCILQISKKKKKKNEKNKEKR